MKRAVVVLLLLIANALFGSTGVTPPDSVPGKLLREWLAAYNSADISGLKQFAEKRCMSEARGGRPADDSADVMTSLCIRSEKRASARPHLRVNQSPRGHAGACPSARGQVRI